MTQRYYSLDIFRGATVALMILVNNPGTWGSIFSPLAHAPWHGLTPTDLVFPFFLFAVGNAMAFVMPRLQQQGDAEFWKKVIRRTILIFLIGLFLNWFPFVRWSGDELVGKGWTWITANGDLAGVRILGVLQRIALCYFFASVIVYYTKPRGAFWISVILLLLYWAMCLIGNPIDPYSLEGWFGTIVDKSILGAHHIYHGEGVAFDPEGLVSTLPAIVQVIGGYLTGYFLIESAKQKNENESVKHHIHPLFKTLTLLFVVASVLLFLGYVWDLNFPINKKIWTSSYVLYTTGLAIIIIAILIYLVEVKKTQGWWSRFFEVFGKNPLFIFAISGLIPKTLGLIRIENGVDESGKVLYIGPWSWLYKHVDAIVPGPKELSSLVMAITFVFLLWAIAYWMDKQKIYIRV